MLVFRTPLTIMGLYRSGETSVEQREPDILIRVEGITSSYGERRILDGVSLGVSAGQITVILGGSGCGKTTLLKNMLGFLVPNEGRIVYFGKEVRGDAPAMVEVLRQFGIVFQNGALIGSMTVKENVELPLIMHTSISPALRDHLVRVTLARVAMSHAIELYPSELSGGMKKRAAIARAMVLGPRVLFCDEPAAGLDPITAASLDSLLLDLRDSLGMTIVIVTHELESIRTIANRVVMLESGKVIFEGPLADALVSEHPTVAGFFARRHGSEGGVDNFFEAPQP